MSKMIKCKTCGANIASNAKTCPGCGAKNKKPFYARVWFWVLIVVVVFGVIGGSSDTNESTKSSISPSYWASSISSEYNLAIFSALKLFIPLMYLLTTFFEGFNKLANKTITKTALILPYNISSQIKKQ